MSHLTGDSLNYSTCVENFCSPRPLFIIFFLLKVIKPSESYLKHLAHFKIVNIRLGLFKNEIKNVYRHAEN
jgi:hypothetical protein